MDEVFVQGKQMVPSPPMEEIRARRREDLEKLDPGVKRMVNPHIYHVSLTQKLLELKQGLVKNQART